MKRERWDAPAPDGESPEAEWGFEETLRANVQQFAATRRHRVVRIVFDEPEDPSPLVAELYRWWYRVRGIPANRLLVDSFIIMDPWWTLRLGAVPFWMKFNTEGSAAALERHLDQAAPCDEIHLMLFAHGVDSIGLADRALAQAAGAGKAVRPLRRRGREGLPGGFRRVRPLPPRAAPNPRPPSAAGAAELGTVQGIRARDGRRPARGRHHSGLSRRLIRLCGRSRRGRCGTRLPLRRYPWRAQNG